MSKLWRNIALFTAGLFIVTLGVEYFRHGKLDIEQPQFFIVAILLLGVLGGYTITWVGEGKGK